MNLAPSVELGVEYMAPNVRRSKEIDQVCFGGASAHVSLGLTFNTKRLRFLMGVQLAARYAGMGMPRSLEGTPLRDLQRVRGTALAGIGILF